MGSMLAVRDPSRLLRRSSLLGLLALAGCQERLVTVPDTPTAPPHSPPAATLPVVASVAFEVDPGSGAVRLQGAGSRSGEGEATPAAVPVGTEHVRVQRVECQGCADQVLDNQTLLVSFAVQNFLLGGVHFEHTPPGDELAAMTCLNCRVRSAELRGAGFTTLEPGGEFEAVLEVDALERRPFTVRFRLTAERIAPTTCAAPGILRLAPPGATQSRAIAINEAGVVLVVSDAGSFLWSEAAGYQRVPIDHPRALNAAGVVVGWNGPEPAWPHDDEPRSDRQAVLWSAAGGLQPLAVPAGYAAGFATDINDAGLVVGGAWGLTPQDEADAFVTFVPILWVAGIPRLLPVGYHPSPPFYALDGAVGINQQGDVVGNVYAESFASGLYWQDAQTGGVPRPVPVPGADGGIVSDINSARQIAATSLPPFSVFGEDDAYILTPGGDPRTLTPGSDASAANAINDQGMVVGRFAFGPPLLGSGPLPFRWTESGGLEQLPLLPGSARGEALGVNEAGYIAGTLGGQAVIWTPDTCTLRPEPSSW